MNLAIIGATRGIGFELLRQAVAAGHEITVLARYPEKLPFQDPKVRVLAGKISRADVAHFILSQIAEPTFLRQAPLLTY